jgi:hypothetical protein
MNQNNSFGVSLNPTIILVVGLITVTVIGNRWRHPVGDLRDQESSVSEKIASERIAERASNSQDLVPKSRDDSQLFTANRPVEPQRLPHELLMGNTQPIGSVSEQDDWITPPRRDPARLALPTVARSPALLPSSANGGIGALVSVPRRADEIADSVDLSAPVPSDPADLDGVRRTMDDDHAGLGDADWRPAENVAPGRAVRLNRLPELPNSTTGREESLGEPESNPVDWSPLDFDPSTLPPLAPPQARMKHDVLPWNSIAAEFVEVEAALRDQVHLASQQKASAVSSTSRSIDNDRPFNAYAVRMSEVTATKHVQAAVQFADRRAFAAAHAELETALKTLAAGADASNVRPLHVHQ